jgi:hypothetical protein
MPKGFPVDLTGRTFGRLRIVRRAEGHRPLSYHCICDCGNEKVVRACNLNNKYKPTRSCGCLQDEGWKHGGSWTREYRIWCSIKQRCFNPLDSGFKDYGARGIKVCPEWMNNFAHFMRDMGPRPSRQHSVERRNNDGDYEPGNCYWATMAIQRRNTRQTHMLIYNGKTQCLTDWANELGMSPTTLSNRIVRDGWNVEKALATPIQERYSHNRSMQNARL